MQLDNVMAGFFYSRSLVQLPFLYANTCFGYDAMVAFIQSPGQLIGAVVLGYATEDPAPRPRKAMNEVLEY